MKSLRIGSIYRQIRFHPPVLLWKPMFMSTSSIHSLDFKKEMWSLMIKQATDMKEREPLLTDLIYENILKHSSFGEALIYRLGTKLSGQVVPSSTWFRILNESLKASHELKIKGNDFDVEILAMEDLIAIGERDPACKFVTQAFLYFKGFKALQAHRFAHILWLQERYDLAHLIQSRVSEVFDIDIHPGASIGGGLMIDHGTGVVIGETAVIGSNCSILHGVTLGGTGNQVGDRHPKLGDNVIIGCGATILGNITIGSNCRIGSGSMILKPLPSGATAVGNPVRVLNKDNTISPHEPIELLQRLRSKANVENSSLQNHEKYEKYGAMVGSYAWTSKERDSKNGNATNSYSNNDSKSDNSNDSGNNNDNDNKNNSNNSNSTSVKKISSIYNE